MLCSIVMLCPNFSFLCLTAFDLSSNQTISLLIYQNGLVKTQVLRALAKSQLCHVSLPCSIRNNHMEFNLQIVSQEISYTSKKEVKIVGEEE